MSDVASLENCKKLFELSGWVPGEMVNGGLETAWHTDEDDDRIAPAYDAGFLLRKLPGHLTLTNEWAAGGWRAIFKPEGEMYDGKNQFVEAADTAEDALTRLAITLFNQKLIERSE